MLKFQFAVLLIGLLVGCSNSHLEIFPELDDPELVTKKIEPELLKEDIDALYWGVVERHPDLMKYANQTSLEQEIKALKNQLTQPLTRVEFYRIIGQLTHQFNDGHSLLLWPYQEYQQLIKEGNKAFPFTTFVDNHDQMFIKQSYVTDSGLKLPSGGQLLSINKIDVASLLESMQKYAGGESAYLRKQFIADRLGIYLWAVYSFVNKFELVYKYKGEISSLTLTKDQTWQPTDSQDIQEDFYFKALGDGTGYLYIGHFDIDPDSFEDLMDDIFAEINRQNIQSLIVDVRDNTGGNTDTATYLTQYLANDRFRMVSSMKEKLNSDNRGWLNYRGEIGKLIEKEWVDWVEPIEDNRYRGEVYLLVSPITYSSGIVFASTMKDHGFATLIGQETGGYANQTAQGNLFNLPHSELRAYVATRILVRPNGSLSPGGVKPHYPVLSTQKTLSDNIDVEIEKALELINAKNSKSQ
ncbi:S41 family peptidase [Pleionea sp. CnH1-48]|uniref:S41 family peptidase n=1 Tax=Pleionea sp. CnH1-48 TaxID=2954494 RepID=UPI0020978F40|nr:S41 family peptidase [Pleionea sp. CnH1-48]MCO7227060.1 S41 family peptidase [Pleionea sp. CnH1-48]